MFTGRDRSFVKQGAYLRSACGFNIISARLSPPRFNVIMIAPRDGPLVSPRYLKGGGGPSLIAFTMIRRATPDVALAYASANGGGRAGIIGTSS